jgi:uncharacterized protein YvpB
MIKNILLFILSVMMIMASGCAANSGEARQGENPERYMVQGQGNDDSKRANPVSQNEQRPLKYPTRANKMILDVPLIAQNPELKYGCEVTSLAMLLQYAGVDVDKMELAARIRKDHDKLSTTGNGDIVKWGDPEEGFVGDMTGKKKGYAVYDKPVEELMERYLPGRTVNLTGKSFDQVLERISSGKPAVVWTTGDFRQPDRWESWKHKGEQIKTPLDLHAVVLVGYDPGHVYVNDPLAEEKARKVDKRMFISSWKALGSQALSYR